jgi:hypothetical protein
MQKMNAEEDTEVDDGWMFEPTLATLLPPPSAVAKSFTKLMHEMSGATLIPFILKSQLHHCLAIQMQLHRLPT